MGWSFPKTLHSQSVMIDRYEAPKGYYPVPKDAFYNRENYNCHMYPNFCMACDWRAEAQVKVCKCMPDDRADGISVVFKREV
jgi:hypothetical protein